MSHDIDINYKGHVVEVTPALPDVVEQLRTVDHAPAVTIGGDVALRAMPENLITANTDGLDEDELELERWAGSEMMSVPAGLWPQAVEIISAAGYQGIPPMPAPAIWPAPSVKLRQAPDFGVLDAVRRQRSTLVVHREQVSHRRLVGQLLTAWPDQRVLIVTNSLDTAHDLRRYAEQHVGGPELHIHHHRDGDPAITRQRLVTTPLGACCRIGELDRRDLVIVLNAIDVATSLVSRRLLPAASRSRLVGLLPHHEILSQCQQDWVRAWFGRTALHVPRPGALRRPIVVGLHRLLRRRPQPFWDKRLGAVLRRHVWDCAWRNAQIARIAWHCSSRGAREVRKYVPHSRLPDNPRVGVYVANLEQAVALLARLGDWRIVHDDDVDLYGLSAEQRRVYTLAASRRPSRSVGSVITPAGLHRVRDLDVLVRADAGVGVVPVNWATQTVGNAQQLAEFFNAVVIDFQDPGHTLLARRWTRRRQAYLDSEWRLAGEDAQPPEPSSQHRIAEVTP